jgi:hypothetical protein
MTTDPMRGWMRRGRVLLVVVALLSGDHDEGARETKRERLEAEAADRRLAEWLVDARVRAWISPRVVTLGQVPNPLPGLPGGGRRALISPRSGGHDLSRAHAPRGL